MPSNEPGTDGNRFINHNTPLHIAPLHIAHLHMHSEIHKQCKLHEQKNVNFARNFREKNKTNRQKKICHGNVLNNRNQGTNARKAIQYM